MNKTLLLAAAMLVAPAVAFAADDEIIVASPTTLAPVLSPIEEQAMLFPEDARQGEVLAAILREKNITRVALTFIDSDAGRGLEASFSKAFRATGGDVAISVSHTDGKDDYSGEVGALAAAGAEHLIVFGDLEQGARGVIQAALDTGAFEQFILSDGVIRYALPETVPAVGTMPAPEEPAPDAAKAYDAAALILLAMQSAGQTDREAIRAKVMEVARTPGENVLPGELAKALEILNSGNELGQ